MSRCYKTCRLVTNEARPVTPLFMHSKYRARLVIHEPKCFIALTLAIIFLHVKWKLSCNTFILIVKDKSKKKTFIGLWVCVCVCVCVCVQERDIKRKLEWESNWTLVKTSFSLIFMWDQVVLTELRKDRITNTKFYNTDTRLNLN